MFTPNSRLVNTIRFAANEHLASRVMPGQEPKGDSIRQKIAFYADGLSSFVNSNLREVRLGASICVATYVILTLRNTRGFYRFEKLCNIPVNDFRNRVKLNGIVMDVNKTNGILKFYHRPIFLRIFYPEYHKIMTEEQRKKLLSKCLDVKLFGVNTENHLCPAWLSSVLKRQTAELTLYGSSTQEVMDQSEASLGNSESLIYGKIRCRTNGSWFKKDIAEISLEKGLTSIMLDIRDSGDPVVSRDVRDNEIVKLEEKYLKCERYAQRNKCGIWENFNDYKPSIAEAGQSILGKIFNLLRRGMTRSTDKTI